MNAGARMRRRAASPLAALLLAGGAVSAAAIAFSASPAAATPIHVSDEASFRTAFDSNANDTIILDADIHLSVGTCADALRGTATSPVTVDGQGQFKIVQDCAGSRVLRVTTASNVTLRGVTITGGNSGGGSGAGINFIGGPATLTIDHSTFVNNTTTNDGGAITMNGSGDTLNVTASTFRNNSGGDDGGAIDCNGPATMNITSSTLAQNSTTAGAGHSGGAIDMEASDCHLTLTNSTVTANTSADEGVINGELNSDTITLVYSTIVNNAVSPAVPGVQAAPEPGQVGTQSNVKTANVEIATPANLTVFGSVIARPHGGPNCSKSSGVPLVGTVSAGYNFADDTSCGLGTATDKQGAGLDPLLGPLASNGGPTQTVLPQTGSPLIDAIPAAACQTGPAAGVTTDQRGVARPQGPGCDIGAVELVVAVLIAPRFTG